MISRSICSLIGTSLLLWNALGQGNRVSQISGSVTDPTSAAIVGASVRLLSLNRVLQTYSNPKGTFRFENLEPDVYALEITSPGFTKKSIPVTLEPGHPQKPISVELSVGNIPDLETCGRNVSITYEATESTGPNLTGTVRDYFTRKPISRVKIAIVSESGRMAPVVVQSDTSGHFAASQLTPGYYNIRLSRKRYESEQLTHVTIPRTNRVLLESTLKKRAQLVVCQ